MAPRNAADPRTDAHKLASYRMDGFASQAKHCTGPGQAPFAS